MNLIFLMGVPGSGKTTIANSLSRKIDAEFIPIDRFYRSIPRVDRSVEWYRDEEYARLVYESFEKEVVKILKSKDVIIESTGTGNRIFNVLKTVESLNYPILKFLVEVDFSTAKKRVEARNKTDYPIKVSTDDLEFYKKAVSGIDRDGVITLNGNMNVETNVKIIEEINH